MLVLILGTFSLKGMAIALFENHTAGGKAMKERMFGILSLIALGGAYLVVRYPLFSLHGMKEFPLLLCIVGVSLIFFTGLVRKNKVLPPIIALGYIIGFVAGALFGYDYGEGLNNLWIIWLWCFVTIVLVGVVGNLFLQKRSQTSIQKQDNNQNH